MVALVGKKLGMTRIYDEQGVSTPITLVQVYETCVSDFKTYEDKNFNHVTLSYDTRKAEKKVNKSVLGFYKKNNLVPYRKMMTLKISKSQNFAIGTIINFSQFTEGDVVNVTGISKGKGFSGGMKRWGFGGLEASHGVSVSHRSLGGTGNMRTEGKVTKGKKMAGQMGNGKVTVKNLPIMGVEAEDQVIFIKGAIPGSKGCDVVIKSSKNEE